MGRKVGIIRRWGASHCRRCFECNWTSIGEKSYVTMYKEKSVQGGNIVLRFLKEGTVSSMELFFPVVTNLGHV